MNTDEQKIFCIGFNKTGTTSLHDFFQIMWVNKHPQY